MTKPRKKTFAFVGGSPKTPIIIDLGDGVDIRCHPVLDGLTLMEFTEAVSNATGLESAEETQSAQAGMAAAKAFLSLLRTVVLEEDWATFETTVKSQGVPLSGLAEIASWLVEQYSETPTEPS